MVRRKFKRPDKRRAAYKRLWANLNDEQRKCLVKYNRIPVHAKNGILYVIPYSRFHNRTINTYRGYDQVSVQEFREIGHGEYVFRNLRCGGLWKAEAAVNVLGIKLLLDARPEAYTNESSRLDYDYDGGFERGMMLEETYNVVVDGVRLLGEKC